MRLVAMAASRLPCARVPGEHCTPKVVKTGPGKYNTARPKKWFRGGLTAQAMKSEDAGVVEFVRRNPDAVIYRTFSAGGVSVVAGFRAPVFLREVGSALTRENRILRQNLLMFVRQLSAPMRIVTTGRTGSDDALKPTPVLVPGAVFPVPDPLKIP